MGVGERIGEQGWFGRGGSWVGGCMVGVGWGFVGGGWKVGEGVFTPAMYLIKTSLWIDMTINEIFKGGVLDSFVPATYLIKTGQSTVTIDGSFSSLYINKIRMFVIMYVCLFVH